MLTNVHNQVAGGAARFIDLLQYLYVCEISKNCLILSLLPSSPKSNSIPGATSEQSWQEDSGVSKNPAALQQNWETQGSGLFSILMRVSFPMQAGYMSGMLVPVGVGIAGALFILGALYSIIAGIAEGETASKGIKERYGLHNSKT